MNKSIIALAIVAALPVAAQADATISGSVKAVLTAGSSVATTSALSISSTEVLANGMTAAASMNVITGTSAKASLAGDFGTLTVGTIDADGALQAGDIAGRVADAEDANEDALTTSGIHYAGAMGDMAVAAQMNGTSTQLSATYSVNGISLGYGQNSVDSSTVVGATYSFGDLSVKVGKSSSDAKAVGSATYAMTVDAIAISATASSDSSNSISATYTLDGIALVAKAARSSAGVNSNSLTATYTSGDLTLSADDSNTVSAALDLGNADLTVKRDAGTTTMTYKVSF
jgi:hypothetical protein